MRGFEQDRCGATADGVGWCWILVLNIGGGGTCHGGEGLEVASIELRDAMHWGCTGVAFMAACLFVCMIVGGNSGRQFACVACVVCL